MLQITLQLAENNNPSTHIPIIISANINTNVDKLLASCINYIVKHLVKKQQDIAQIYHTQVIQASIRIIIRPFFE